MRYAMLQVLGLQSEQDILNADVANLVHDAFNSKRKGADAVRGGAASEAEMYNMTNATDRGVKRSKLNLSQKTEEAAPAADTAVDKKPELQPA
jgi:hypothetical protein